MIFSNAILIKALLFLIVFENIVSVLEFIQSTFFSHVESSHSTENASKILLKCVGSNSWKEIAKYLIDSDLSKQVPEVASELAKFSLIEMEFNEFELKLIRLGNICIDIYRYMCIK